MKKNFLVRIPALALVFAMLFVAMPAFAASAECPLCGSAEWTEVVPSDWLDGEALVSGHYKLPKNVILEAPLTIAAGETVCIDLAGFNITASGSTSNPYRVFENSGTLTILDSTAETVDGEYVSGVISGGYMYAGSNINTTYGGNIWCADGSVLNLYSGTVSGGTIHRKYHSKSNFGGGNIYSEGDVNIYGGLITKGYAWANLVGGSSTTASRQSHVGGGNIYVVNGLLTITGGSITDGKTLNEAYGKSAPGTFYAYAGNVWVENSTMSMTGGTISGGVTTSDNKGADSASGTEVISKALGGNISLASTSNLMISGGTVSGGTVSSNAVAVDGKTLTSTDLQDYGGNIFGSSKSSIRISGGEVLDGKGYKGGNIYAGGTINITDGTISGGVAKSDSRTADYGGNIFANSTITVVGNSIMNGVARRGVNIYVEKNFVFTAGTIKGGVAIDRGGNIGTMGGTLNISGGNILEGTANNFGGNIWCGEKLYVYDGEISNPISGGNITLMSNATGYIYGGTIYDGEFGEGIYAYDGSGAGPGNLYVYGGNIVAIRTGLYGSNNIHIYNGFVGRIYDAGHREIALTDLDANADGTPVVPECVHINSENGYIFWHHFEGDCEKCGHTYGSSPCEACSATHKIPGGGSHTYEVNAEGIAACIYCGLEMDGKACCAIDGEYYADIEEALTEAKATGKTVKLIKDMELENLNLYGSLDLAGYKLTVTGVLGAENKEATLMDSVGTGAVEGKLFVRQDNPQLPVPVDGLWKLERVALNQTIEKVSEDEVTLKFIITDAPEDTLLDEAAVNGDEYKVRIEVKWTENGEEKFHFFRYTPAMVKEYAAVWGEKMFTCTITGLSGLENYKITAQVVSGGACVSAKDITPPSNSSVSRYESGDGYKTVGNMLTWENLNAFPLKNENMTVREMRQLCADYYNFSKTFTWVANEDNTYDAGAGYGINTYYGNSVYGGFAYVSLGTGNLYRFMDFMDEKTGVVNLAEANKYPTLFGNQCSQSAYYAWGRFVNSLETSIYTAYMVESNGYIPVGPYTYDKTITEYTADYGTGKIIEDNGAEVMYESYAQMQIADGLVRKFPGGHTVMCVGDPVVVRDENGKIDPEKSYIMASDQTAGWSTTTNAMGDSYSYTKNVNAKWSFSYILEKGYLPFTFGEFLGTDPIEETVVTYSHTGDKISQGTLFGSTVTSNYDILDIYAVFTDSEGNEVYKLANRAQHPFVRSLSFDLTAEREGVPGAYQWGSLEDLSADETYTVEIIAQLATGERPTLWQGRYVQ